MAKAALLPTPLPVPFPHSSDHRLLWLLSPRIGQQKISIYFFRSAISKAVPTVKLPAPSRTLPSLVSKRLLSRVSRCGAGTGWLLRGASLLTGLTASSKVLALLSSTAASTRFLSHAKAHYRPIRALRVLMLSLLLLPQSTFFRKSKFTSSTCLKDNKPNSSLLLQSP